MTRAEVSPTHGGKDRAWSWPVWVEAEKRDAWRTNWLKPFRVELSCLAKESVEIRSGV